MPKNKLNFDSILDEHLDMLIKLAYKQAAALEAQEILEKDLRELHPEEEETCRRAYVRFQQIVEARERAERRQMNIRRCRKWVSHFVGIAACIVLLLGIAAPIAIANVDVIRAKVLRLLINVRDEYTELSLIEDPDASFDVPAGWEGEYFPSYIPEGYVLYEVFHPMAKVYYVDEEDHFINFDECDANTYVNVDSEDAEISYDLVNGNTAMIIEKVYHDEEKVIDSKTVIWSNGYKYFIIDTELSVEETLKIAESVRRIH